MTKKESDHIYPYKKHHYPRLNDRDGDMKKKWEIRCYFLDEKEGKPVLVRIYGMNEIKSERERRKWCTEQMQTLTRWMHEGYVRNAIDVPTKEKKKINLIDIVEEVLQYKEKTLTTKPRWYITFRNTFNEFCSFKDIELLDISEFKAENAHDFLDWLLNYKEIENKTYNNYLTTAVTVFNYYKDREFIRKNPFEKIKSLQTEKGRHLPYSNEQRAKIKELCRQKGYDELELFIDFIYYTFIRPNELKNLKVSDLQAKTIVINAKIAKNRKTEFVEIPRSLENLIQKNGLRNYPAEYYIFGQNGKPSKEPILRDYFYYQFRDILQEMDLYGKGYVIYAMKHTGVINLFSTIETFKELKIIQRQCRHSSFIQTETYLQNLGLIVEFGETLNKFV